MTGDELSALVGFLCSGVLLGIVGSWVDQLLRYVGRG